MKRRPILSYDGASHAARSLGIMSAQQYGMLYREDPGLPGRPALAYRSEWKGWSHFLGKPPTPLSAGHARSRQALSLADAAAATRAAGITTRVAYLGWYRTVPGLPSNPEQHYPEWPGWPAFFGRVVRAEPPRTVDEFAATVRALGITSATEYAERYRERSDLPSNPYRHYPDFPGWRELLKKWEQPSRLRRPEILTFAQAQATARSAGWVTSREYYAGRRAYPGLPLRPDLHYEEWRNWMSFLNTRRRGRHMVAAS